MLETIHKEEDSRACQNKLISDFRKLSVEGRDEDSNQVDKLESNSSDDEDNVVIVDIVCTKQKSFADKSEDFNSDNKLAISRQKPDIVLTRRKRENNDVDFLPDISDEDDDVHSLSIENNSKTVDDQEETSLSPKIDSALVETVQGMKDNLSAKNQPNLKLLHLRRKFTHPRLNIQQTPSSWISKIMLLITWKQIRVG